MWRVNGTGLEGSAIEGDSPVCIKLRIPENLSWYPSSTEHVEPRVESAQTTA